MRIVRPSANVAQAALEMRDDGDDDADQADTSDDEDIDFSGGAAEALGGGDVVLVEQAAQRASVNDAPLTRGRALFVMTGEGRFVVFKMTVGGAAAPAAAVASASAAAGGAARRPKTAPPAAAAAAPVAAAAADGKSGVGAGSTELFSNTVDRLRECTVEFPDDGVAVVRLRFESDARRLVLELRFGRKDASGVLATLALSVSRLAHDATMLRQRADQLAELHEQRRASGAAANATTPPLHSLLPPPPLAEATRSLCIVHFNDTYNLAPTSMHKSIVGGASRFSTVLQSLRDAGKHPLVVFSGDFMGPSLMSVEMRGRQMIDCFNLLGVNFGSWGNHELDYGLEAFREALWGTSKGLQPWHFHGSSTTWVATNLVEPKTMKPALNCEPYAIVRWGDVRVGVLGLVENWLSGCSRLKAGELKYLDIFEVGESAARELKHRGAEFVIALTHCRLSLDKQVSARCPSIDLILGGHDHFYKSIPKARLVKSGEEFKFLTEINVKFRQGVTQPTVNVEAHAIVASIPPDPAMEALIGNYEERVRERMGVPLGVTAVTLDPTEETVRFREGSLTAFFCDLMADETGSDIALLGGAAVAGKRELPPGPVTFGDILEWFPNNPKVMMVRMNGRTLQRLVATMAKDCPAEAPSFPHCSSALRFVINVLKRPAQIEDMEYRGLPLRPDQSFTVALEDFAAKGKGHYSFLKAEAQQLVDEEGAQQLVDWVVEYFTDKKGQQRQQQQQQQQQQPGGGIGANAGGGGGALGRGGLNNANSSKAGGGGGGAAARAALRAADIGAGLLHGAGAAAGTLMTARRRAQQNTGMMMREVNRVAIEHMGTDSWLESIDHSALAGVYATLSEMLEPCESFRDLLLHVDRLLRKTFSCERMRVMVCDEAGACLKHYSRGDYVNAVPMATGGIAAICATRRVLMRTNNAQNDDFFDPDEDTLFEDLDAGPIKNMLSAPGNFQESSVVVVQLVNKLELFGCAEAAGFSLHDCELFAFLTRHLAQHFVATEYYAALIRAEASTRQLIGIASSIVERSITRSLTDVMFEVQTKAAELLQCDRCVLLLVQSGGGSLFGVSADAARARTKKYNQQQHMMMAQQQQQQQHQQSQDDSTTAAGGGGGGGGGGVGVDGDGPSPPPAPAAKGIVKEDELEFRSASEGVVGAAVAKGRTINVDVARDHEDYIAELDASYIGEKCAAMIMPLQSSRGRDIVIGALAFSGPKRPGQTRFLVQDVRLGEDFATFCSIAIEQCYEVQRLHVSQEGMMQAFPSVSMRRVVIKAGWQTVRNLVAEFRKRKLRNAA